MNKYEEALSSLTCKAESEYWFCQAQKRKKRSVCLECNLLESVGLLQELVSKATPKKPNKTEAMGEHYYACPRCGIFIKEEYHVKNILKSPSKDILPKGCPYCLQALDWSEEE